MRETITLKESGIKLVPPMDVVVNFFGAFATWFLKEAVVPPLMMPFAAAEQK